MAAWPAASADTWYSGSSAPIIRLDQSKTRWRSSWGTPIRSAMTWSGQLGGDLLDEVGRSLLAHGVEDGVGGGHHLGLEVPDHPRGEPLVDQAPVAGVHRRVHVDHHHPLLLEELLVEVVEQGRPAGRGEVLVVPVDPDAVVEAGDRPEPAADARRGPGASRPGPPCAAGRTTRRARRRRSSPGRRGRCRPDPCGFPLVERPSARVGTGPRGAGRPCLGGSDVSRTCISYHRAAAPGPPAVRSPVARRTTARTSRSRGTHGAGT